jgi:hypothetical protein
MPTPIERKLGPQAIAQLLERHGLCHHDLVEASDEQITHKPVARACKGRWLTLRVRAKFLRALQRATGRTLAVSELFDDGG